MTFGCGLNLFGTIKASYTTHNTQHTTHKKYENFVVPGQYSAGAMVPFVVSAGGGVSREAREMITMINTEVARDEKTEALRINGAFSIILLRYATKLEEEV